MRDRLTERLTNGGVGYINGEYFRVCYPWNDHCLADIDRIAIKLCDLEDKIEQGKILELPFKLGGRKRLYYPVKGTNTILETRVFGIGIDDEGDVIFNPTEYPEKVIEMRGVEIGKTVFLTREEAEKALERSANENH